MQLRIRIIIPVWKWKKKTLRWGYFLERGIFGSFKKHSGEFANRTIKNNNEGENGSWVLEAKIPGFIEMIYSNCNAIGMFLKLIVQSCTLVPVTWADEVLAMYSELY